MAAKRSVRMALRVTPEVRGAIERLAEVENRTVSAMIERLLNEAIAARTRMPEDAKVAVEKLAAMVEGAVAQRRAHELDAIVNELMDGLTGQTKAPNPKGKQS